MKAIVFIISLFISTSVFAQYIIHLILL